MTYSPTVTPPDPKRRVPRQTAVSTVDARGDRQSDSGANRALKSGFRDIANVPVTLANSPSTFEVIGWLTLNWASFILSFGKNLGLASLAPIVVPTPGSGVHNTHLHLATIRVMSSCCCARGLNRRTSSTMAVTMSSAARPAFWRKALTRRCSPNSSPASSKASVIPSV